MSFCSHTDTLTVLFPMEDSPAYSEGIHAGDQILKIDSTFTVGLSSSEASELIKGEVGSKVILGIFRPSTKEKINILKEADYYFINHLRKYNLYHKIWQAYAALLPVKTVGVMGDNRTYEHICLLRAITSEDGMTADFFNFNKKFLQSISNKIINNIKGINRVVYDVTSKPPSTIELE